MTLAQELHRNLLRKKTNQMELLKQTKKIKLCLFPLYKQPVHPAQSYSPSACPQQDIPLPWAYQAWDKAFGMQEIVRKELWRKYLLAF